MRWVSKVSSTTCALSAKARSTSPRRMTVCESSFGCVGLTCGAPARIESSGSESVAVEAERLVLAVGITGNVEDLGLESTRARVEKGHIVTDGWGATDEPGLHAIGDVAGPPYLAHKANHEGICCVERIAGYEGAHSVDKSTIPGCTYSRPQIASVGLTEQAALDAGHELRVGRFPFQGNGKALAIGESQGFAKTIFDASTGEEHFRERVQDAGEGFTASPVAGDGLIYLVSEEGRLVIIAAVPELEVVARADLGEICMATPAIIDGGLIFRLRGAVVMRAVTDGTCRLSVREGGAQARVGAGEENRRCV